MSLQGDNHDRGRRKSASGNAGPPPPPPPSEKSRKRSVSGQVGKALKSAYNRVVDEDIPPEMLDLLGKLG